MSQAELVVAVADLERGSKQVTFALSEAFLRRTLEGTEATPVAPGQLDVTLSKNGGDVLVRGKLKAEMTMPCVVTLDPVPVPVDLEILLMLSPRAPTSPGADPDRPGKHRGRTRPGKGPRADGKGARGPAAGHEAPEPKGHWEETPVLTEEDAGKDTYEGHEIALDSFVREFLILELPMYPRRSDLPTDTAAANPPLPADSQPGGQAPLDPRLSPLAELKSRLEKMKKE